MFRAMLKDGSWVGLLGLAVLGLGSLVLGAGLLECEPVAGCPVSRWGPPSCCQFLMLRFRRARYGDGPTSDEREEVIRMRGDNAGALALMVYWALVCLVPVHLANARHARSISIDTYWLMLAFCLSCGLFAVVRTLVIRRIRRMELANGEG